MKSALQSALFVYILVSCPRLFAYEPTLAEMISRIHKEHPQPAALEIAGLLKSLTANREWQDATGRFSIQATVIDLSIGDEDDVTVILRRTAAPDRESLVKVPLNRLDKLSQIRIGQIREKADELQPYLRELNSEGEEILRARYHEEQRRKQQATLEVQRRALQSREEKRRRIEARRNSPEYVEAKKKSEEAEETMSRYIVTASLRERIQLSQAGLLWASIAHAYMNGTINTPEFHEQVMSSSLDAMRGVDTMVLLAGDKMVEKEDGSFTTMRQLWAACLTPKRRPAAAAP